VKGFSLEVQILDVRLIRSNKPLKAFADIKVGGITIRDFRIMKEDRKPPHVKVPFSTYKGPDGQLRFRPIIILPDEVRGEVDLAILNAYRREKEQRNGKSSP
jgi:DNA-binding cell septation regulator SpoVG